MARVQRRRNNRRVASRVTTAAAAVSSNNSGCAARRQTRGPTVAALHRGRNKKKSSCLPRLRQLTDGSEAGTVRDGTDTAGHEHEVRGNIKPQSAASSEHRQRALASRFSSSTNSFRDATSDEEAVAEAMARTAFVAIPVLPSPSSTSERSVVDSRRIVAQPVAVEEQSSCCSLGTAAEEANSVNVAVPVTPPQTEGTKCLWTALATRSVNVVIDAAWRCAEVFRRNLQSTEPIPAIDSFAALASTAETSECRTDETMCDSQRVHEFHHRAGDETVAAALQSTRCTMTSTKAADVSLRSLSTGTLRGRDDYPRWLRSLATVSNGVELQPSTLGPAAGLGLFAGRGFRRGDSITEFEGQRISKERAGQLRAEEKSSHIISLDFWHEYVDGIKVPSDGAGGASFANDGSYHLGGPGNNARFVWWDDNKFCCRRIFLRAKMDIQPGEEVFVSYASRYWRMKEEDTKLKALAAAHR